MGDQDINLNYEDLYKKLSFLKKDDFDRYFSRSKNYPERPRVSSSAFWQALGFVKTDRLDLFELERNNDVQHNFFKIDLNYPIENQTKVETYDFVTDIGNNEHPFNLPETLNTMHKITKKNGFMLIQQSVYGGNGFYNFNNSLFECMSAVNNYSILFSSYIATYKKDYFYIPINNNLLKTIDVNILDDLQLVYLLKKNSDDKFVFPYQELGKTPKREEFYFSEILNQNFLPERTYVPMNINDLSARQILKNLINKIKSRLKK